MAAKKRTPKKAVPEFSITLTMGPDLYQGTGANPVEALRSLPKPEKIMTKGVLTVMSGELKKVVPMTPVQIKRVFYYGGHAHEIIAKRLFMALK